MSYISKRSFGKGDTLISTDGNFNVETDDIIRTGIDENFVVIGFRNKNGNNQIRFKNFDDFEYFFEKLKKDINYYQSRSGKTVRKGMESLRLKVQEINKELKKIKVETTK